MTGKIAETWCDEVFMGSIDDAYKKENEHVILLVESGTWV